MARRAEARAERLKVVPPRYVAQAPVLTLADAIQLYYTLHREALHLDEQIGHLRQQLLRTLEELGVNNIRFDDYEVIRQIRRFKPALKVGEAEKLLERFGRLREAKVERIDEEKVRAIVNELQSKGLISEKELPYETPAETEVLIVRRVEEQAPEEQRAVG